MWTIPAVTEMHLGFEVTIHVSLISFEEPREQSLGSFACVSLYAI